MLELYNFLSQQGLSWIGVVLAVIFFLIQTIQRLEYFHKYYVGREFNNVKNLLNLKDKLSEPALQELAQDVIDEYAFRKCTNITANKKLRELILTTHKEFDIELLHFKIAHRFFRLTDSGLEIHISKLDIFGKYFNYFFSGVLFLCFVLTLFLFSAEKLQTIQDYAIFLFSSILFGLSAIYVFAQNLPLKSALYLKEKLGI